MPLLIDAALFKNVLAVSGLIALTTTVKAQTTTSAASINNGIIYSVGAEGGFSAGSFKNISKWNLGGSIQADIPVAQPLFVTVNAGYTNFYGKNDLPGTDASRPDINYLPVRAGLKYFIVPCLYAQADAGAGFVLNKNQLDYQRTAAFIYSPQVGVLVPLSGKNYIDAGAFYEASTKFVDDVNSSKINYFGLRIAYAFSF